MEHSYSYIYAGQEIWGKGHQAIVHMTGHGMFLSPERKKYIVLMIRYWGVTPVK